MAESRFGARWISVSLQPLVFYYLDHSLNSSLKVNEHRTLILTLQLGTDYYLLLGKSIALSFGGSLGFGILPRTGLDQQRRDIEQ